MDALFFSFYIDCLKYTFVIFILLAAVSSKDIKLILAESFILPADYFLLFTQNYTVGVFLFLISIYMFILRHGVNYTQKIFPLIFFGVYLVNKTSIPSVYIVYVFTFYFHLFLLFKNNMTHIAMAFVFFAVCDICVALNYMHPNIIIGYNIWLLYGISQLLIINYAIPMRRYTKSFQYHYLKYL